MYSYKICKDYIMGTSDPSITFDNFGVCEYYHNFNSNWC